MVATCHARFNIKRALNFIHSNWLTPRGRVSWEANISSITEEIGHILYSQNVHDCIHKNTPQYPIQRYFNTPHPIYLKFILGAFAKELCKLAISFVLSVCRPIRQFAWNEILQLDEFSWNLIFCSFSKICWHIMILVKIGGHLPSIAMIILYKWGRFIRKAHAENGKFFEKDVMCELRLKKQLSIAHETWSILITRYRELSVFDCKSHAYDISIMVEYNSVYKTRENLTSVLKYWTYFWHIFENITYRGKNRAKSLKLSRSAHIS